MSLSSVVAAKIGTSSITDEQGEITRSAIAKLCAEVAALQAVGHHVAGEQRCHRCRPTGAGSGRPQRPGDAVPKRPRGPSRLMQVCGI
jgi:hypothetical protein